MIRKLQRSIIVFVSVFLLTGCEVYIEPDAFFESDIFMEESIIAEESIEESVPENEPPETTGEMEVHFIDVGQGDATLVICDD